MTFVVPRLQLQLTSLSIVDTPGCHLDYEWYCAEPLGVAWSNAVIAGALGVAGPINLCCESFNHATGQWGMSGDAEDLWPGWPGSLAEIGSAPACPAGPCSGSASTIYARSHFMRGECGYEIACETGGDDHLLWSVRNWAWAGTNWCYENGACACLGSPTYGGDASIDTPHSIWKDGSSAFRPLGYFGTEAALCAAIVASMIGTYTCGTVGCVNSASITVSEA